MLGEEFAADLDPEARQRIQAVIDRGERELDLIVKQDVADATVVLDSGRTPAGLADLQVIAKGTEHEQALAEAVEDRDAVAEFLQQPLAEQTAVLRARPDTTTRRDLATEQRMRRAHGALAKQIADGNGLRAAEELDVFAEMAQLDISDPATLKRRVLQAEMASDHFGVPVAPVLPAESAAIAREIAAAPADQAVGLLSGLHDGFGRENTMAFVAQIADRTPELAFATIHVADDPLLAREIISGGRLLRENGDVRPSKEERQTAIADVFGTGDASVFTPDTATALRPILDAASALYAGRVVPTGDLAYDADAFEQAVQDVTGGVFEFNGRRILAPVAGMSEDLFEDAMERLNQADLIEFGNGIPVFADGSNFLAPMFESRLFGPEAQLVSFGFGQYLVEMPGLGFIVTTDGEPYELDLGAFIRDGGTRLGTSAVVPIQRGSGIRVLGATGERTPEGRRLFHNSEGGVSSELSITINDERINNGRATNIPSIFDGKILSQDEAIERIVSAGGKDPETGRQLPGFDTIDEAVAAAKVRSRSLRSQ